MLPKPYRLKKRTAFSATYKTGVSFHKGGITMFCGKLNTDKLPSKIGFVVSKKFHKRAVKRNRAKRLMRESIRLLIKNGELHCKYMSIIFAASQGLLNKDFDYVNSIIKQLVSKL